MTLPITGPFTTEVISLTAPRTPSGVYRMSTRIMTGYRQSRPYDRPLPFSYSKRSTQEVCSWAYLQAEDTIGGISDWQAFSVESYRHGDSGGPFIDARIEEVRNRCRVKLDKLMSDTASTLTSLVEARSTVAMVENRLLSIVRFSNAVRRGNAKAAVRHILEAQKFKSISKEKRRVRRLANLEKSWRKNGVPRDLGSAWLEAWFGWLPTIGDVQKGVEVLSRDFPVDYVRVRSSLPYKVQIGSGKHVGRAFASAGMNVQVVNSNLYLASQLGLTNPLLTAVEVIPYSWLLGWVTNLNQYFKQFSQYQGIRVDNPWHLVGISDACAGFWNLPVPAPRGRQTCLSFKRSLGTIPGVTLRWTGLNQLSWTRGATAASLLASRLPSEKDWTSRWGR